MYSKLVCWQYLLRVCNNGSMKKMIKHIKSFKLLSVKLFNQLNA